MSSFLLMTTMKVSLPLHPTYTHFSIHVYLCLKLKLASVFSVLTEKIDELGESLRSHFNIEEFSPVSLPAQVHTGSRFPCSYLKFYLSLMVLTVDTIFNCDSVFNLSNCICLL